MDNQLQVIVKDSGLESTKAQVILQKFQDYFSIAADWEAKAKTLVVTNDTQKAEMAMARTGRLFLRDKRIAIEKTRKEMKEQALREGKAIDGIANVLKALIEPIETYLDSQEHFVEIKAAKEAELKRIEVERRIEEERIAKEKADAEERERIRVENERLKKEAIAREEKAAEERRVAEKQKRQLEEKAQREREAGERKIKEVQEKAAREKQSADAAAKMEREKAEMKIRAERAKAAEEQRKADEALRRVEQLKTVVANKTNTCPKCGHQWRDK
jgi:hypothetical protein